jgi:molybdopterin converting factor small subunit
MPTIQLFANLRKLAGTKELSITGATLAEVLSRLVAQHPALDGVILKDGQIRPHFVITISGQITTDLTASVTEQDVIAIFPPIAGGTSPLTPLLKERGIMET